VEDQALGGTVGWHYAITPKDFCGRVTGYFAPKNWWIHLVIGTQ